MIYYRVRDSLYTNEEDAWKLISYHTNMPVWLCRKYNYSIEKIDTDTADTWKPWENSYAG